LSDGRIATNGSVDQGSLSVPAVIGVLIADDLVELGGRRREQLEQAKAGARRFRTPGAASASPDILPRPRNGFPSIARCLRML
jgi:hypothetical protein